MKIVVVIGARPQFIKHAPFEIAARGFFDIQTIHTGQHYDDNMSKVFFDQLGIRTPNHVLQVGSGSHGYQTGRMLHEIETILIDERPDALLVYGDTNSTIAGALAAAKLQIPVVHVEAGLRSFNKMMPEEVNRILTDHTSHLLFTSTPKGRENLANEGIKENVFLVGDIMLDSINIAQNVNRERPLPTGEYYFATIHRPYNTDSRPRLLYIYETLNRLDKKVIFSLHPRTKAISESFKINLDQYLNIEFISPVSYFDGIFQLSNACHVITDSGGIQKEAYILKTPCITIRSETEWLETLTGGWNVLCFDDLNNLSSLIQREQGQHFENVYGNGKTASEIVRVICNSF